MRLLVNYTEALEDHIQRLIEERSEAVAKGVAADFAEYQSRCGEIRGLKRALEDIPEIRRRFIESDDDDV